MLRRDLAALRRLMYPDFVLAGVPPTGPGTLPLEVWLDNLVNKTKIDSYSAWVTRVRVYGDTALAASGSGRRERRVGGRGRRGAPAPPPQCVVQCGAGPRGRHQEARAARAC